MADDPTVLGDRYELGEVIGRGGMAEVRRARDTRLGRDVAVKQLRADLAGDPTFQARFRREAQSAAGLNHPTIVSVYDTGTHLDPASGVEIPYIVMELVEGHTLRDVLRDGRRILPTRALELTAGVLDALNYSHKAGIIHRDIKPANVMLTTTGAVKVMDFGIARAVSDTAASMTQTAAVIGTAQYLSPEQARGETVDNRSDVYSAGCLLYELLTGRPPFQGDSPVSVAYQHVRETPLAPSQVDPDDDLITPAMDAIVMKSLAKDPADRYQSAQEMKEDITRLLSGQDVTATIPAAFAEPTQLIPTSAATPATAVLAQPVHAATPVEAPPSAVPLPVEADGATPAREMRRGTNPFVAVLLTILVLAVLGAAGWGIWAYLDSQKKPVVQQVAVPGVVGFTETQARTRLDEVGLNTEVKHVKGPEEGKGLVSEQDPLPRIMVDPGTKVTITINDGPETVTIPAGLKGQNVDAVSKALADLGLKVTTQEAQSEPAAARAGEVVELDPGEGQQVAKGTQVALTVATGKVKMPDLTVYSTYQAAHDQLQSLGFTQIEQADADSDKPEGNVIDQNPKAGTVVDKATPVTVTVAKRKPSPSPSETQTLEPSTPPPSPRPTITTPKPSPTNS